MLLALASSLSERRAIAEPTVTELTNAREAFARAEKEEEREQWAEALEDLKRAASVKMTAGLRFHMAHCEASLGHDVAALENYSAAWKLAGEEHNKDVLDAVAEPLERLRAKVPTLTLRVPTDAGDVQITLDAKPLPSALWGKAVPLDPGVHRLEAVAPGRASYQVTLTVKEREASVVDVKLVALTPRPEPATSPATTRSPPPREGTRANPALALLASGGAVLLAGAGVGAYLLADGKQSTAKATCGASVQRSTCDDARSSVQLWDALALGAWAGASVVGAVAVILWLRPAHEGGAARLVLGPSAVRLEGSF